MEHGVDWFNVISKNLPGRTEEYHGNLTITCHRPEVEAGVTDTRSETSCKITSWELIVPELVKVTNILEPEGSSCLQEPGSDPYTNVSHMNPVCSFSTLFP